LHQREKDETDQPSPFHIVSYNPNLKVALPYAPLPVRDDSEIKESLLAPFENSLALNS